MGFDVVYVGVELGGGEVGDGTSTRQRIILRVLFNLINSSEPRIIRILVNLINIKFIHGHFLRHEVFFVNFQNLEAGSLF